MDISTFVAELLSALASLDNVGQVTVKTEGPIVNGRAFLSDNRFLAFYYNQTTGTQAFAMVKNTQRIWGLDFDNFRGWHLHPFAAPDKHVAIEPQTISTIIDQLKQVL